MEDRTNDTQAAPSATRETNPVQTAAQEPQQPASATAATPAQAAQATPTPAQAAAQVPQQAAATAQAAAASQGAQAQIPYAAPQRPSMSAAAIVGLVFGIIAAATSIIPIVNNAAFFGAIVALVFGVVGLSATRKGKRRGKGIAVAAIVLAIISVVAVLASQSLYGSALDEASKSLEGETIPLTATSTSDAADSSSGAIDGNSIIYDDNGVVVSATGRGTDWYSAYFELQIENNSDRDVIVTADDVSCDGTMVTAVLYQTVTAGKRATEKLYLTEIEETKDLKNVEGTIQIVDASTYRTIGEGSFAIVQS